MDETDDDSDSESALDGDSNCLPGLARDSEPVIARLFSAILTQFLFFSFFKVGETGNR